MTATLAAGLQPSPSAVINRRYRKRPSCDQAVTWRKAAREASISAFLPRVRGMWLGNAGNSRSTCTLLCFNAWISGTTGRLTLNMMKLACEGICSKPVHVPMIKDRFEVGSATINLPRPADPFFPLAVGPVNVSAQIFRILPEPSRWQRTLRTCEEIISVRATRRFSRSVDRRGAGPSREAASTGRDCAGRTRLAASRSPAVRERGLSHRPTQR